MRDLERRLDQAGATGAVAILDDQAGIFTALHTPPGVPRLSEDARFPVASISKTVLAVAVMSLVDDGHLDLHRAVSGYLAELAGSPVGAVTLHQLLTHTAGMPLDPGRSFDCANRRDLYDAGTATAEKRTLLPGGSSTNTRTWDIRCWARSWNA